MGLCAATRVAAILEAGSFGWQSAEKNAEPDSETWGNYCGKRAAINFRVGMTPRGIGHFTLINTMFAKSTSNLYSARNTTKPVNFYCVAPSARSVYLVGDFNGWDPTSHPMRRRVDGCWFIEVQLTHGHHQYRFLVDDNQILDPLGSGIARNERNERVSLLAVS